MKIALAQINTVPGNISHNVEKIKKATEEARKLEADLVVFPELTVSGYDPKDLLLMPDFLQHIDNALENLAEPSDWNRDIAIIAGYPEIIRDCPGQAAYNSCALIQNGKIEAVSRKILLPNYDVLEESRFFSSAPKAHVFPFKGLGLGLSICEDVWNSPGFHPKRRYSRDPVKELVQKEADIIINLSASPFHSGKPAFREKMLGSLAAEHGVQVVMVNKVGGNDGLIFDGSSLAFAADGKTSVRCFSFEEDIRIFDTCAASPVSDNSFGPEKSGRIEDIHRAIILGIRDFSRKNGFKSAMLGLSGGMDSALVAALAAEALGSSNVLAVYMPSRYSSMESFRDARETASNLGIEFMEIPVESPFSSFIELLSVDPAAFLNSPDAGSAENLTLENIQPRIRSTCLMALANRHGHLLLSPGNKSEIAVGYCTLYGDMAGGLAPIGDLLKTDTYRLAKEINRKAGKDIIPESVFEKAPSAELRPNQRDDDSLPPYEILDPIIAAYLEEKTDFENIVSRGYDRNTISRIIRLIHGSEHKRRQSAPILKISPAPFDSGFRLPIISAYAGDKFGDKNLK